MTLRIFEALVGAGVTLLALVIWLWGIPAWVEPNDFVTVAPDLMPRVAVGAIGALGAMMCLHRLFLEPDRTSPAPINPKATLLTVIVLALFAVTVTLMLTVGYLVGGVFITGALTIFMGQRSWWAILLTAVCPPLLLWGFFEILLGIPLP
ncbi:Tripartite tricarboxylate transporter TctB family protein [Sulfitobacter sp. THAF37]|uniref:tripartite tricarboxylate transporter TctB family protein n=1 Tax=Sulfitobacter sp. THAF37 TaxID=2587855 RepID=UPI001267BEC0|nr:tripartite tricarboxylate transporter TctB family protein [Sulfitobacter sp. THAF37]QFT59168.1 Tripartite tricarboxylate transporter TctB family protein [Sulfitobacter sp. THAF37]